MIVTIVTVVTVVTVVTAVTVMTKKLFAQTKTFFPNNLILTIKTFFYQKTFIFHKIFFHQKSHNSNCDEKETQTLLKLKNSDCDGTQKLRETQKLKL